MGTHIVGTWYAEWVIRCADGRSADSESDAGAIWEALSALEAQVRNVSLDAATVEITLGFEGGSEFVARPDPAAGPTAEGWEVLLPGDRSVVGYADGIRLEDSRDAPRFLEDA
jgi:hypothetical protein